MYSVIHEASIGLNFHRPVANRPTERSLIIRFGSSDREASSLLQNLEQLPGEECLSGDKNWRPNASAGKPMTNNRFALEEIASS